MTFGNWGRSGGPCAWIDMQKALASFGGWLFRYRGQLPLPVVALLFYLAARMPPPGTVSGWLRHWDVLCLAISLLGQWMRIQTVGFVPPGTSGRNTRDQLANFLNTTGMYAIVRHPLYVANFLLALGCVLYVQSVPFLIAFLVLFAAYYHCIMLAEEQFLMEKFGGAYHDWAARTPRFIPNPFRWTPPSEKFSLRLTIRREGITLLAMLLTFCLLEILQGAAVSGGLNWEPHWIIGLFAIVAVFALHRFLRKKTDWLARTPRGQGGT